jgi:predicted regulator of Ras-like GTPase activity (Roadblock/LC7/MglB family)
VAHSNGASASLGWLLDDLVARVPPVRHAVVLSVDGLLVASSGGLSRDDADHMSAVAAGFQSLAKGAGRHFHGGPVRQTTIEMESAFLFVSAAGPRAALAVLSDIDSDLGVVGYEMAMLITRVGEHFTSPLRPGAAPVDVG